MISLLEGHPILDTFEIDLLIRGKTPILDTFEIDLLIRGKTLILDTFQNGLGCSVCAFGIVPS